MEYFLLLQSLVFLQLVAVSHSAIPAAQLYWNSLLPHAPMPSSIQDLLNPHGASSSKSLGVRTQLTNYNCGFGALSTQTQNNAISDLFFLEKDLQPGTIKTLHFDTTPIARQFLSREASDSIPFSSSKIHEILAHFSIEPNSTDAEGVKTVLRQCEEPVGVGETKRCATSLESMVDFGVSSFRTREIRAMSTTIGDYKDRSPSKQNYTVNSDLQRIGGSAELSMACHGLNYMYAVFYCHGSSSTKAYEVAMVGNDGAKVDAIAVCHVDTSRWSPRHFAFRVLNVKPGSPVCHFMPPDHIVWIAD